MDLLSTIINSISLVGWLREISKNLSEAEFNNLLADLSNELADEKLQMGSLKEEIADLRQENKELKRVTAPVEETRARKYGCYQFEGVEGLYCNDCYDTKKQKILTTRFSSKFRMCPVCKGALGA